MNKIVKLGTVALTAVAFSAPAFAQSQTQQPTTQTAPTNHSAPAVTDKDTGASAMPAVETPSSGAVLLQQRPGQATAQQLIGMTVVNRAGEDIGEIQDLVLDQDSTIAAAVVSVGGFLGIGAKDVGVAWTNITVEMRGDERVAMVDVSKDELTNAPEFRTTDAAQRIPGAGTTATPSPRTE